ncbi:MAG: DNA internalization-related competence protein ComEC/Rec2 [Sedimentisphaerales bacterium]|nr:DNA internalization-related competence protein ComEC/Rec2 [Sedimentisphaerales bacterium]
MDDIRRKLAQIDRQLAGRNLHEKIITTCPLLFVTTGFITGILVQDRLDWPVSVWLIPFVLLVTIAVLFFFYRQSWPYCRYVTAYLAFVCFFCLGAVRLADFRMPDAGDIRNFLDNEPKLATIHGLIISEPHINKYPDWKFARFKPTDPSSSFYLKLDEAQTNKGGTKMSGILRVQVGEPVYDLKAGDYIRAYCLLESFSPTTNPGQFDFSDYLADKNIFLGAMVEMREGIEVIESPPAGIFVRFRAKIRQIAARALSGDLPQEDSGRGLLQALLLGYRGDIDSDTYEAFRKTGLLHFISLSGLHLGILIGIIWWLCKTAGLMKPARAFVCIISLVIFLLIVPARAPTLRAAVIGFVFCLSFFFRRRANPVNTLSLAAVVLLLIRPTQLFEPGWQLSFATVLGILVFTDKIAGFLRGVISGRISTGKSHPTGPFKRAAAKFADKILSLFSVGLAAWLGGAGILLYHFYTITPLASLWTVLVFPLVAAILTLGFFKMILFFILPTLSFIIAYVLTFLSELLVSIVKLIASLDISQILIGRVPPALVLFYYGIIIFAGYASFRRPLVKRIILVIAIAAVIISIGVIKRQRTHRSDLIFTCLDVGHGQAILLQMPGRANVLFDAGSMYKSDIGGKIVAPFMNYAGTNRIDAVIISHNDVDHINGIPELVEYCRVGEIYANDDFFNRADQWGTAAFLEECLKEKGFEIEHLGENLNFSDKADIKILRLSDEIYDSEKFTDNDKSLVSLIEFAGRKILLCSDIEQAAQKEFMRQYPGLVADIVVVPHHGSVNTLEPGFLESLNGEILICSCGRGRYRNENDILLNQSGDSDAAKIFYTYKKGAVTVRIAQNGKIESDAFIK